MLAALPVALWAQPDPGDVGVETAAVMIFPFANVSGNAADDWVGVGITETVTGDLQRLGQLRVISGDLARDAGRDPVASSTPISDAQATRVASQLDARWVIVGSVQRVGQQLRVIARLIDVATGDVEHAVRLDGRMDELFDLQDRVVPALAERIPLLSSRSVPTQTARLEERNTHGLILPEAGVTTSRGIELGDPESSPVPGALGILAGRPTVRPARTPTPPDIDGRLDDEVWQTATRLTEFVQQQPRDGAPATEDTEVYIAYDNDHIYFGFYVHYADPSIMRANRVDRDQAFQDDLVSVFFDPFLDQQRAYVFDVNGYGVQGDGIINAGGSGGGGPGRGGRRGRGGGGGGGGSQTGVPQADRSWDALFDSGAQIVGDGYTAEMAIPFKSLRYPRRSDGAPHRWGFQIVREIKGKDEENVVWAPMSRDVQSFMAQMGVLDGMTGLSTSRNLEILPTFTGIKFGALDGTGDFVDHDLAPEAGLNVKYGITSNLTADLALNPDFSQIESDRPQVTVNQRFPLFFEELRPIADHVRAHPHGHRPELRWQTDRQGRPRDRGCDRRRRQCPWASR